MDQSQSQVQKTMDVWPNTSELREKICLPLTLTFSPTDQENTSASFNQKNLEKYRCQSCKAFINKFCLIRDQNSYECSLCGFSNHIDEKIEINSPELNSTSYKCKALKIQRTVMSKQRVFVFILDLSNYDEMSQKYLLYSIHAIKSFVNRAIEEKKNIKIMLLGFDDGIQIFNIKNQVQRLIFWDDQNQSNALPFSYQQIATVQEAKDNILLILEVLQEQINHRKLRNSQSKKIIDVVEYALKNTRIESGKIFVISGINHELQKFKVMRNYDSTIQDAYKHHYHTVKKQCLTENMLNLLSSTQMSVSFFLHKTMYANLMPFHIITKSTNGELRHYFRNQAEHFFYEFNYLIHQCLYEMKFQTLLRVRSGVGLKLVGIYGNYRSWKGIPEQVELISCQTNRKYTFQFIVQGKINSPWSIVQFSILYTDLKGNRFYRIVTEKINLASQLNNILPQINYQEVNEAYLRAILHNMDCTPHYRKLQLALQQRCQRHIRILRESQDQKVKQQAVNNQNLLNRSYMRKARSYVIFTFMLMQHFLLNMHQQRDIFLDLNIEARSKLATYEDSLQIIWPICYILFEDSYEIVEMKKQNFQRGTIGILIDRGDRIEIYFKKQEIKNSLRMTKDIKKAIQANPQLQKVAQLLQQIQNRKSFPHLDILIVELQYIMGFCIFSRQGNRSFDSFIQALIQN